MAQQSNNILKIVVLLISILVIYLRRPSLFLEPRLWGEEGTRYFYYAYTHPWYESLINFQLGYFALWPNIASTIAANLVPLIYVPLVTTFFALAVQIVPIILILWGQSSLWQHPLKKIASIFIILFTPLSNEIWLNTISSQFYFSVVTFLVLLNDVDTHHLFKKWISRILLVCAGLTGVLSCFLTPLFLFKAWWEHRRERMVQACILVACTVVQLAVLWMSIVSNTLPPRFTVFNLPLFASILWTHTISLLLFGVDIASEFAHLIELTYMDTRSFELTGYLLLFAEIMFFLYISSKLVLQQRVVLVGSFFLLFILTTVAGLGSENDKFALIFPNFGARYFYAPNVVLMFLFLANIEQQGSIPDRIRSGLFAIVLATALIFGIIHYQKVVDFIDSGPTWSEEVLKWQEDRSYSIKIWPAGWQVELPHP